MKGGVSYTALIIMGGRYNGNLDLRYTPVKEIKKILKTLESVVGWLDLSDTGITSLPEGLSVGGSLDLRGTAITSLPEGLSVGGEIYR